MLGVWMLQSMWYGIISRAALLLSLKKAFFVIHKRRSSVMFI